MDFLKKFTKPNPVNEISDWRKVLPKRLNKALQSPVEYSLFAIEQFGNKMIPEESYIRIPIEDISELDEILRFIEQSKYRDRLSYKTDELEAIFDHEKDHILKAKDLGYSTKGSVILLFYYRNGESTVDLSISLIFSDELEPLSDMEVCLAPNKPSKSDLERFMGLLLRLDMETVDMDRLYDLLNLYALKTNQEFITDIDEIYRRFRGVKKITLDEVKSLEPNSRIEIDQNAYLFLGINSDGTLRVADNYREYNIHPQGKTICIDLENAYTPAPEIITIISREG